MPVNTFGRRYERLLFASAPISFTTLIILFIAVASTMQESSAKASCYKSAAYALEKNQGELDTLWEASSPTPRETSSRKNYTDGIIKTIVYASLSTTCHFTISDMFTQLSSASPSDNISKLKQEAAALSKMPLVLYGIELPEKASINILGTDIKIELMTLTRAVQIALSPIIILWLGSLYNTRYRESILIGSSKHISENFPHIINVYPAGKFPVLLKPNWFLYHLPKFVSFFYACIRVALLLVFVAPPVIAFELSLFFLHNGPYTWLFIIMGILVGWFAFVTLGVEFFPWHYHKLFPEVYKIQT